MTLVSFLSDYERDIEPTDTLGEDADELIVFGLFGEVGSVLSVSKKARRDAGAFDTNHSFIEELGDVLWYFCRLCNRKGLTLSTVAAPFISGKPYQIAPTGIKRFPLALVPSPVEISVIEASTALGKNAAVILEKSETTIDQAALSSFFESYIALMSASGVSFKAVVDFNLDKSLSRFSPIDLSSSPDFDAEEHIDEQLPREFEIEVSQRSNGKTYMKMHGVFIGDPLTDNIAVEDGYRFHDVFHMAYAAILHWSPVFRALLKQKRKSNPGVDESQDGGRAIVIEEGLSAWVFSLAKENDYFEGQDRISFDVLKTVKQFVKGYEVERCSYKLFEKAILDGYSVFRELKKYKQGTIIGSRIERSITFRPAEGCK
ncbi:MazG nucleotide pyrophosphohydrolase domain-containing protein [Pseudomonas citronellolis]|uniref:MazG nucleotide pyrophosphohydrolase domain-containing protein n=1 Tax=Pseudomonas citronellolis TaxID=53408 RepID=A0AAQ1HJD5_9PSED|nr:nucleoside triphosphate pyrophosphohydrolase family protein [Pseudomonas citronellolis]TGC23448.1 hypothetical protein CW310_26370 [Pseudomonas citronellolis]SFC12286.1 MazG nucleotide pyrophosphohydrolase domain-containing protein [Pseudomonas citronellolis]